MKNIIKHPRIYTVITMIILDYLLLSFGSEYIISRPNPNFLIIIFLLTFVTMIGVTGTIISNYIKNKIF